MSGILDLAAQARASRICRVWLRSRHRWRSLIAAPGGPVRPSCIWSAKFAVYLALASLWNLLAGYTGLVSVGQQAYVGLGGYTVFRWRSSLGIHPLVGDPWSRAWPPPSWRSRSLRWCSACKGPISPSAPGSWRRCSGSAAAQVTCWVAAPASACPCAVMQAARRQVRSREASIYWLALALGVGCLAMVYLLLRSRIGLALDRHPRQRDGLGLVSASASSASNMPSMSPSPE